MAEYIAKEQIKYHRERVLNHWAGSRHYDEHEYQTLKDVIKMRYTRGV